MATQPRSSRRTQPGRWTGALRDSPWPAVAIGAGLSYLLYRRFGSSGRCREVGYRYDERRASARAFEVEP